MNVVIHRLPSGGSLIRPGSSCPSCKSSIRWWDNIPLISFLCLLGKCRSCKTAISPRYPLVEVLTALVFCASLAVKGPVLDTFLRDWPILAILIAVCFIDLSHRIIPDSLSLGGWGYAFVTSFFSSHIEWQDALAGGLLGFFIFFGFSWLYFRMSGKEGLGGGDVKLLGFLGAFLGISSVLMIILVSSVAGSLIGGGLALAKKSEVMGYAIPYGPFLVLGALVYYFFGGVWLQNIVPM